MDAAIRNYMAEIGRRGGAASRRHLSSADARRMVQVREARRAYRRFHAQCFWSYPHDLEIVTSDVSWVAGRLMKHGGRRAWELGARLCR